MNLKVVVQTEEKRESKNEVKENYNKIAGKKIGRNEPCTCGSGKKFKHCCGTL